MEEDIDGSADTGVATNETAINVTTGCKVTNISLGATKEIKFSDSFSLPLSAAVIANQNTDKVYLVATISF